MIESFQFQLTPAPASTPVNLKDYITPRNPLPFSFYQAYPQNISNDGADIILLGLPGQSSGFYVVKAGAEFSVRVEAGDDLGIQAVADNTITTLVNVLIATG